MIFKYVFFKDDFVFPNGVRIEACKLKYLDDFSSNPDQDRDYINKFFIAMFSEKYLFKKIQNGMARHTLLEKLRETKRYVTIKGI